MEVNILPCTNLPFRTVGDTMAYNPEWKITWDQLAPSLQSLFTTLQTEMTTLQTNYRIMVNKLDTYTALVQKNATNIQINASDIALLKKQLGSALTDIDDIKSKLANIDLTGLEDLSQLRSDVDWCLVEINDIKKLTPQILVNRVNITDLRIDLDRLEEFVDQYYIEIQAKLRNLQGQIDALKKKVDENSGQKEFNLKISNIAVDIRTDLDRLEERTDYQQEEIDALKILSEPTVFRILDQVVLNATNIDNLTVDVGEIQEEIPKLWNQVNKNTRNTLDNRIDIDRNTENINTNSENIKKLFNQVIDNRIDIDRNTELIEENEQEFEKFKGKYAEDKQNILNYIIENRSLIYNNTEMIQDLQRQIDALPDELMKKLKDYIASKMFLNLAPKINFNQEDTIELYPMYNMNNTFKFGLTSDYEGNETLYVIANSGVALENYDLFQAYRTTDVQKFYYSNTAVSPACFLSSTGAKVSYITDMITCSNDYMIAYVKYDKSLTSTGTDGWYLINTNSDREFARWTECKNISAVITDSTITARYFADYDTLIVVNKTQYYADMKNQEIATVNVYKYSDMSFLGTCGLESPYQILTCDTNVCSFDTTQMINSVTTGNCADLGYDINTPLSGERQGFQMTAVFNESDMILTLLLKYANITYVMKEDVGNTTAPTVNPYAIKRSWKITKDFLKGTSISVTPIEKKGDLVFNPKDTKSYFTTGNIQAKSICTSYDEYNGKYYVTWHNFTNYRAYFDRYIMGVQNTSEYKNRGENTPYFLEVNTPDACPWGKWFFKYIAVWDNVFVNCASTMYGNCVVWIKDFKRDPTDVSIVLPQPGSYKQVNPLPVFTKYGDSSCKTSDGSPRYFHAELTGDKVDVYEYLHTQTDTDFKVTEKLIKTITLNLSSLNSSVTTPYTKYIRVFYNYNADNIVAIVPDNSKSSSSYSNYAYIAVFDSSGNLVKCFGESNSGIYSIGWRSICKYVQDAMNDTDLVEQVRTMTFLDSNYCCFSFFYASPSGSTGNTGYQNIYVKFSSNYQNMEIGDGYTFNEQVYTDAMPQGTGLIYSGKKYGLFFEGEKADHTYQSFLTQNPLITNFGTTHTDDEMIINGSYNRYAMQLKSANGLVIYVPAVNIFLGGFYSQMESPLTVTLEPNSVNYIYLERNGETREIIATKSTKKMINEGARTFRKILLAAVTTDDDSVTGIVYYHINIGYNDYKYHPTT